MLLREACGILEGLDVTVEVSEPLQCWWEKEKRKKEVKNVSRILSSTGVSPRLLDKLGTGNSGLVSGSGTPIHSEQETKPTNE